MCVGVHSMYISISNTGTPGSVWVGVVVCSYRWSCVGEIMIHSTDREGVSKAARSVSEQQGWPYGEKEKEGAEICQERRPWFQDSQRGAPVLYVGRV